MNEENNALNGNNGEENQAEVMEVSSGNIEEAVTDTSEVTISQGELSFDNGDGSAEGNNKKSKAPVIIGVAAAVAAVVAVGAAVTINSPEKALKKAFVTTGTAITSRDSVFKNVIAPEVAKSIKDGSYTLSNDLTVVDIPGNTELNGLGFSTVMNVDNSAKQGNISLKGTYKGLNLDILNAYTDNEVIMLNMPALCKSTFSMSTNDILGQIKASPVFSQYLENSDINTDEEISIKFFDEEAAENVAADVSEVYFKNLKAVTSEMKYSKAEPKEVELAQGTVKCVGYKVDLSSQAATDFFVNTITGINDCESVKERLNETADIQYLAEGYDSPEEYLQNYNDTIQELTTKTTIGDVAAVFYVNKGIIVDSEISCDITYDGSTAEMLLNGGLDTDDGLEAAMTATNAEGEKFIVNYSDSVDKSDSLAEVYSITFGDEAENVAAKLESNYTGSTWSMKLSLGNEYSGVVGINAEANVLSDKEGTEINASKVEILSDDNSVGQFSYDLSLKGLSSPVEKPEGDSVNIFEIDENEFENITKEIQQGLFGVMMQLQ